MNKHFGVDKQNQEYYLNYQALTKHGLITGSTGSGKTTTVKKMIELLHQEDIPTLAVDIKGDLSSLAENHEVEFLDFYGKQGKKLSLSIENIGIYAFANLLDLSNVQTGVLATAFLIAKDRGYCLDTTNDLYKILHYMSDNNDQLSSVYGHLSRASVATIIRKMNILKIEENDIIFNYDNFDTVEVTTDCTIRLLEGTEVSRYGKTYSTLILTLLRALNNDLEEVGNIDKPKLAFFIDETHLLFNGTTKEVKKEITEIIKLIRSKGVAVIFISQLPSDIPNEILSQLGLKIQHGLRLYTANDYKTARNIARSFSGVKTVNDTIENISSLGTGQVMIQQLDKQGKPKTKDYLKISLPTVSFGVLDQQLKENILNSYNLVEREQEIYQAVQNDKPQITLLAKIQVTYITVIILVLIWSMFH